MRSAIGFTMSLKQAPLISLNRMDMEEIRLQGA